MVSHTAFKQQGASAGQGESILLLHPEQIVSESPSHSLASEQNAIIRLAGSIKKYGILNPLAVCHQNDGFRHPQYLLIDGVRRYRAALLSGVTEIPVRLLRSEDIRYQAMVCIQQIKSNTLHFLDFSCELSTLLRDFDMTQEEIARKIGLSQSAVANKLRLLHLDPSEREYIRRTGLSERHARLLLRLKDRELRRRALEQIAERSLTVSAAEQLVDQLLGAGNSQDICEFDQDRPDFALKSPEIKDDRPDFAKKALMAGGQAPLSRARNVGVPDVHFANTAQEQMHIAGKKTVGTQESVQGEQRREGARGKFILRDLQPLYHSIDRTLDIFRKTGASAKCERQEGDQEVRILITIPKPNAG